MRFFIYPVIAVFGIAFLAAAALAWDRRHDLSCFLGKEHSPSFTFLFQKFIPHGKHAPYTIISGLVIIATVMLIISCAGFLHI